jgi:hypothetical protein
MRHSRGVTASGTAVALPVPWRGTADARGAGGPDGRRAGGGTPRSEIPGACGPRPPSGSFASQPNSNIFKSLLHSNLKHQSVASVCFSVSARTSLSRGILNLTVRVTILLAVLASVAVRNFFNCFMCHVLRIATLFLARAPVPVAVAHVVIYPLSSAALEGAPLCSSFLQLL